MHDANVGNGRDRSVEKPMPERKLIRFKEYDYSSDGYYYV